MSFISLENLLVAPDAQRAITAKFTHADFCDRALRIAGGLQAAGWQRIAVHLDDALELACMLFGAWRADVAVVLPPDRQPGTQARMADQVDAWIDDADQVASLLDNALAPAPLSLDLACLVIATSGSTGAPKSIDKHLAQLSNEVAALETVWGTQLGNATILGTVSAQHIYGLLFRVLWPLAAGRTLMPEQLGLADALHQASTAHAAVAWVASPAMLKRLGPDTPGRSSPRLRAVFSSGGPLPADTAQALRDVLDCGVFEIYGSSETGGIAWRADAHAWQPLPGVVVGQHDTGVLWIRSPFLAPGHTEVTNDGVRLDGDGFHLLGRVDRIVKLEEKRISLPTVEAALRAHPWVDDARLSVISTGRAYLGALLALNDAGIAALRESGRRALIDGIRGHLANDVEDLALPRRWRLVRELPSNAQGKLSQEELDAHLQAPRPASPIVHSQRLDEDGQLTLSIEIPLDLAHFSGHFVSVPVVPGVLQITWAQELAKARLDIPPRFAGMEVIKFQQLLRPGDQTEVELRFDAGRGKLHFAFRAGERPVSSGRIRLEAAHA